MRLLALDTSSPACSAALQVDDSVFVRHVVKAREHTRLTAPMIESLLAEAELRLDALDAVVLGNGPGSFIGMRIAASVAQGLAFAAGKKIVPVSSMAAVAAEVIHEHGASEVVVAQDAHMNEVYLGIYASSDAGLPELAVAERLHGQTVVEELDGVAAGTRLAAGFGWQRYPALLQANREHLDDLATVLHPSARYLLGLGARGLRAGDAIDPQHVVPAYLRQKVVEKPVTML